MFDSVIADNIHQIWPKLVKPAKNFYLAGGIGLALQLGHRKSIYLGFFSADEFTAADLVNQIHPEKIIDLRENTLHCLYQGVRLTFLHYAIPLIEAQIDWHNISVAHAKDILAEKFKLYHNEERKRIFAIYRSILRKIHHKTGLFIFLKAFQKVWYK